MINKCPGCGSAGRMVEMSITQEISKRVFAALCLSIHCERSAMDFVEFHAPYSDDIKIAAFEKLNAAWGSK